MRSKNFEIIVGLFVVVVLLILGWLTTQMGKFSFKHKPTYTIYAPFKDVSGLDINTKVKVAGVTIGVVRNIELKGSKAVVTLAVYKKYRIPKNSIALIKSKSLLGEKFLEIQFGNSNKYLKNGDYLTNTESAVDIGTLVKNINKVFNTQNRENITKAIEKISDLSQHLDAMVQENRDTLKLAIQQARDAMQNFNKSMDIIKNMVKENKQNVKLAIENARYSMEKLNKTLDNIYFMTYRMRQGKGSLGKFISDNALYNNINSASSNINKITGKINNGKGTIGKLINDDSVYNNLDDTLKYIKRYLEKTNKMFVKVSVGSEYNVRNSDSKGYVGVDVYTMPDKFYRIGLVDEKNYKYSANPSGNDSNKMRLIAEMGKRYYNFVLRGGIMESTFGVGADYYALNDKFRFSLDAFDFNHNNDIRDHNAQLKAQLSYTFWRHFSLFGGVNEILNSKSRSVYIGGGIEFSNNDLKYFVGNAPVSSFK